MNIHTSNSKEILLKKGCKNVDIVFDLLKCVREVAEKTGVYGGTEIKLLKSAIAVVAGANEVRSPAVTPHEWS